MPARCSSRSRDPGFRRPAWICVMLVYALWMWAIDEMPGIRLLLSTILCLVSWGCRRFHACIGAVHFLRRRASPDIRHAFASSRRGLGVWASARWMSDSRSTGPRRMPSKRSRSADEPRAERGPLLCVEARDDRHPARDLAGRPLRKAAEESADLVRQRLADAALLRIGILGSAGPRDRGLAATLSLERIRAVNARTASAILWLVGPIVVALAFILLFARPVYVLASCGFTRLPRASRHAARGSAACDRLPGSRGGRGRRGMEASRNPPPCAWRPRPGRARRVGRDRARRLARRGDAGRDATCRRRARRLAWPIARRGGRGRGAFDPVPGLAGSRRATIYLSATAA